VFFNFPGLRFTAMLYPHDFTCQRFSAEYALGILWPVDRKQISPGYGLHTAITSFSISIKSSVLLHGNQRKPLF
jgi:hypothetical protein